MIETLSSATASLEQEDPLIIDLEITGITFEGGDLSQPLYPSLINYDRAPEGVQFEPGLQIIALDSKPFTVLFQIGSDKVEFMQGPGGAPVIESVAAAPDMGQMEGLSAELTDPRTCRLTWNQTLAASAVTALRIRCQHSGGSVATAPEEVDGGVYLAIVHRPDKGSEPIQGMPPGDLEPDTIKVLGTDAQGRPRYDLFLADVLTGLSPDLELEVCFRVREGHTASFSLVFSTPDNDIRFQSMSADPSQVPVQPERPWQLRNTGRSELGDRCTLLWVQNTGRSACMTSSPAKGQIHCLAGRVDSFFLEASEVPPGAGEPRAALLRSVRFDPTVIQPPSCTSSGICITM
ncbi:MAG TPA: hypothetical protein VNM67_02065 [Thermoanaerobaculia bacterium]|jgi:hypothetical protein|nr:hypothetical protein [Thermoanaerobaculia bacterium]